MAASLVFEPGWDLEDLPVITLVAGLAVLDVVQARVGVKWPNDIVIRDAKAGGILTESSDGLVRVGLGLNVYWAEPPEEMIALHDRDPGVDHVHRVAERWAEALVTRVGRGSTDWGADEYAGRCVTIGRQITWEPSGAGVAIGIAPDGGLVVETLVGKEVLHSGAVHEVRPD